MSPSLKTYTASNQYHYFDVPLAQASAPVSCLQRVDLFLRVDVGRAKLDALQPGLLLLEELLH